MTTWFCGWRCAAAKLQGSVWCVSIGVQCCRQDCGATRCSLSSYPHGYVTVFGVQQCGCYHPSHSMHGMRAHIIRWDHLPRSPFEFRLPEGHIFHIMHMHKLEHLRVSHCLLQSELLLRQHCHRLHPSTLKNRGRDGDADRRQRWPRLQQSRRAAARHTGPLPASEGGRHSCSVFGTAGCVSLKAHHCAPTRVILCKVCVIPRSWRPGRCTTGGAGALGARGCLSAPWATSQGWWS